MIRSVILGTLLGAFTGVLVLGFVCIACLVAAFATSGTAEIPGIFSAAMASAPNGTPQLRFLPNFGGMGIAYLVWVVASAGVFLLISRSRGGRRVTSAATTE